MTTQTNQPVDKIKDGNIVGTVWFNETEKGGFYSGEITRTYKKGDGFGSSHTMSGTDLLKQSRMAQKLYDEIRDLELRDARRVRIDPIVDVEINGKTNQIKETIR